MKLTIALTDEAIREKRISFTSKEKSGFYIRLGKDNIVDRVIGWDPERTLINDKCYQSGKSTFGDIWQALNDKEGFVTITKYV